MTSGGLGTMGYGFPAAVGVQVGNKDKKVFALAGDGSFQMNCQELATVAKNKLPINIIIFNNGYLGMVRQWQEMFYERRYSSVCLRKQDDCPPGCSSPGDHCPIMIPDFVKLAEAYGIKAKRVSKKEDVRSALEWASDSPEPILIDFIIEEEENVFPMVPPGGSLDKMVLRGDVE